MTVTDDKEFEDECPDDWHLSSLPWPTNCPTCGDGPEPEWWSTK